MRRPLLDPRTEGHRAQCPLVADRGPAAHASEQPRPRGGREARGADRLRRLRPRGAKPRGAARARPLAARARARRDAARPERQARRRLPHPSRRTARPDRERDARPALGDLGRVPPPRGARADDVRADDRRELDLHRHPGDPAGHLPDLRRRGCAALRGGRPRRAHRAHRRARRHGRRAAARRLDAERGHALRRGRPGADRAPRSRPAISTRRPTRSTMRWRGYARRQPSGAGCPSAWSATPPTSSRSWPAAASASTSSPTRPRRTIR